MQPQSKTFSRRTMIRGAAAVPAIAVLPAITSTALARAPAAAKKKSAPAQGKPEAGLRANGDGRQPQQATNGR
jgi:hypothetical protein